MNTLLFKCRNCEMLSVTMYDECHRCGSEDDNEESLYYLVEDMDPEEMHMLFLVGAIHP